MDVDMILRYSQYQFTEIIQIVQFVGVYSASFLNIVLQYMFLFLY
jgi:hypothetical protein